MKIIEQFTQSKYGGQADNEDGIFINENFVAVIDGVTSKGKKLWGDKLVKSGLYAKEVLLKALGQMRHDISGENAIQYLNKVLSGEYENNTPSEVCERLQAVIIIYSKYKKEIWIYGDCQCLVNAKHYFKDMLTDKVSSGARALYLNALLKQGLYKPKDFLERDIGRELIAPLLEVEATFANSDCEYGYGVLNGVDLNFKHLEKVKIKKGDVVVFASDGYPKIFDSLAKSENHLIDVIKKDPLCINEYKSTKCVGKGEASFDDRTFVSFVVE